MMQLPDVQNVWAEIKVLADRFWVKLKIHAQKIRLRQQSYQYKEKAQVLWKKFRQTLKKIKPLKLTKRIMRRLSDSWRLLLGGMCVFLFVYYALGSSLAENIDTSPVYFQPKQKSDNSEMIKAMAALINREVDEKMWTPNLPLIFPATILDNMPNFQIGVIKSVRDSTAGMRHFTKLSKQQSENLKAALQLLRYPPDVWLMNRRGTFGLAPSSNAQYRKARNELIKFNDDGYFAVDAANFAAYLEYLSMSLRKIAKKNEEHVQEYSADFWDFKADNRFYQTRGYVFGARQVLEAAGQDFKPVILKYDVYTEWTFLLSSLQKAADFSPLIVRDGKAESQFVPNHLIVQNYFLERALAALERIRAVLAKGTDNAV